MAYRTGVTPHHAVRDGAVACDEAVRNARPTMIAGARPVTGVGVGGMGLEAACAVTASPARRGVEGMKAAATKTTSGMKATAAAKTASRMKAAATMEPATHAAMEATASTAMETASTTMETAASAMKSAPAPAMARLGYVCERQPHECAREDTSECQRNLLAAHSSQHV